MNSSLCFREASEADLPGVLQLYAQPDLDDGKVLAVDAAGCIFERMTCYPNYKIYVAIKNSYIVGTFALLILDNVGRLGTPSAIIEDIVIDPSLQR